MLDEKLLRHIEEILNQRIISVKKINFGFNRTVYLLNGEYILKSVTDTSNEEFTKNEVAFLSSNNFDFTPSLVYHDFSKQIVPYIYYLEKKSEGESLLYRFPTFDKKTKQNILDQLLCKIEELHSTNIVYFSNQNPLQSLQATYEYRLNKLIESNMFSKEQIEYLMRIGERIPSLFKTSNTGLVHGDLHFGNILITENNGLQLIDFETTSQTFIESEFDPIHRMQRNPDSFNPNENVVLNKEDFNYIIEYLKEHSTEVNEETFDDIILFYDCLNSLMWICKFPDHKPYSDILFNRSRKLL